MADANDMDLLREFARTHSEAAFAELVGRHLNLVYSVAVRLTGNSSDAQDVAQAVFIILAQKAAGLPAKTVLTGWLYETTRFTALRWLRSRSRRQTREQEASMQSINEGEDTGAVWSQIAPHLESAMSCLGERDRTLLALRYYENQTGAQAAARLGIREEAARRQTNRALEKLRRFLVRRGVGSTAAIIVGAISANSLQAAPAALAVTVTAAAMAGGAGASASTLTLIKGALKVMAWMKAKTAITTGAMAVCALVVAGGSGVLIHRAAVRANSVLSQRLEDGSVLTLSRVSFGDHHPFGRGGANKPYNWPGHEELWLEFRLRDSRGDSPLVAHPFFRQYRFLLRGERGIEFVEQFVPEGKGFTKIGDAYYGNVETGIFPRDSRWLWLRLERRDDPKRYDNWRPVAEFKFPNPATSANRPWTAAPTPATNRVDDLDLVLKQVQLKLVPSFTNDIWNHQVTVPTEVWKAGRQMTNWGVAFGAWADASGNALDVIQYHRSLDPQFVWRLDLDFEPVRDFPPESVVTLALPRPAEPITTNVMGVPVTVSFDNQWIDATVSTNEPGMALKFIRVADDAGVPGEFGAGSWSRYRFRQGDFMFKKGTGLTIGDQPVTVTFAVVPNVHTTFYTQPVVVPAD
jgi:RNA polymerase sigma factor (sigma-70 family)